MPETYYDVIRHPEFASSPEVAYANVLSLGLPLPPEHQDTLTNYLNHYQSQSQVEYIPNLNELSTDPETAYSSLIALPVAKLQYISTNPYTPALLVTIVNGILKDIKTGTLSNSNILWDRVYGKAKQSIDIRTTVTNEELSAQDRKLLEEMRNMKVLENEIL
jgi:hypothetical protein